MVASDFVNSAWTKSETRIPRGIARSNTATFPVRWKSRITFASSEAWLSDSGDNRDLLSPILDKSPNLHKTLSQQLSQFADRHHLGQHGLTCKVLKAA